MEEDQEQEVMCSSDPDDEKAQKFIQFIKVMYGE